jgi:two-component system, sensor histidine kinase PdtaS
MSALSHDREWQMSALDVVANNIQIHRAHDALVAELNEAHMLEKTLRRELDNARRKVVLADELDHRLVNSMQLIVSLLSSQARIAAPEAAAQLMVASRRVAAFAQVHHQLHLLDSDATVEFKSYFKHLCEGLSNLIQLDGSAIVFEGAAAILPTELGVPLGFIVSELVTNSAKYARGPIVVRFETSSPGCHVLSVSDCGQGLPAGFNPAASKGLGMKLVQSLVQQIDGHLRIGRGNEGRGACFAVDFRSMPRQ